MNFKWIAKSQNSSMHFSVHTFTFSESRVAQTKPRHISVLLSCFCYFFTSFVFFGWLNSCKLLSSVGLNKLLGLVPFVVILIVQFADCEAPIEWRIIVILLNTSAINGWTLGDSFCMHDKGLIQAFIWKYMQSWNNLDGGDFSSHVSCCYQQIKLNQLNPMRKSI